MRRAPNPLPQPPSRRRALWRMLPVLAPALLFIPIVLAPPLNPDVAAVFGYSQRWLAGERLYVDLIDVNPPLIYLLNLIPAELARLTGLEPVATLQLCLLALAFWLWRLAFLVRDRRQEPPVERVLLDVLPGLLAFAVGSEFGQREALMVAAALPYLLAAARRASGARPHGWLVTAVVAALGFALKPHFLAIPALVELAVLAAHARRAGWAIAWRDPVPWVMAAVWAAYGLAVALLLPAYLTVALPLALRLYLGKGGLGWWPVLGLARVWLPLLALPPLLWLAFRRPRGSPLPQLLGLAAVGGLAAALAQDMGWTYHFLPPQCFVAALAALLAARWLDRAELWRQPGGALRGGGALAMGFAVAFMQLGRAPVLELRYRHSDDARLTWLLRHYADGGWVLALSTETELYPALNYAHARLALRTQSLWTLRGAYPACLPAGQLYRPPAEMAPDEAFVFRGVAEDFARRRPAAVLVDTVSEIPSCAGMFNFLDYFQRNKLFAETWAQYRLADAWGRYRLYVRK